MFNYNIRKIMKTITKTSIKSIFLFLCLYSMAIFSQEQSAESRPNFIFIITDDMRWDAMGVVQEEQGEKARFPWLKTPHLDQLASESTRFQNAMVATSVCSPSRAEYLTGRYGHFNGVANNQIHFPADNVTYATELKKAGYTTGYIGKWHMQNQVERPGFDYSASYIGQGQYEDWFFLINGVKTKTEGWIDDVSTDFAIDFISKDHEKPFALALGFKTPHIPFIPPARAKDRFAGEKVGPVPNFYHEAIFKAKFRDSLSSERVRMLISRNMIEDRPREEQPTWALDYFRCISAIDENVGRLMDVLKEKGLDENTGRVFASTAIGEVS
jgi:arylsulfatase A-like enzyme